VKFLSRERVYIVLATAPESEAERLARSLVESRLAACVNVASGLTSFYWWKGSLEESRESLLIIKTTEEALEGLIARLREMHPYELPEIIAVPVEAGLEEYLDWVRGEVRSGGPGEPEARGGPH
jgi:periplasmic divalent cation tolerance protein